jgi:hypothetical protein
MRNVQLQRTIRKQDIDVPSQPWPDAPENNDKAEISTINERTTTQTHLWNGSDDSTGIGRHQGNVSATKCFAKDDAQVYVPGNAGSPLRKIRDSGNQTF